MLNETETLDPEVTFKFPSTPFAVNVKSEPGIIGDISNELRLRFGVDPSQSLKPSGIWLATKVDRSKNKSIIVRQK